MKWFVAYFDGYDDVGIMEFDTDEEALEFINSRYRNSISYNLADYTLIHGNKVEFEPVKVVTKVRIKKA